MLTVGSNTAVDSNHVATLDIDESAPAVALDNSSDS